MNEFLIRSELSMFDLCRFNGEGSVVVYAPPTLPALHLDSDLIAGLSLEDSIDGAAVIGNKEPISVKSFPLNHSDISFMSDKSFILKAQNIDLNLEDAFSLKSGFSKVEPWFLESVSAAVCSKQNGHVLHRNTTGAFVWSRDDEVDFRLFPGNLSEGYEEQDFYLCTQGENVGRYQTSVGQMLYIPGGVDFSVVCSETVVLYSVSVIDLTFRDLFIKIASEIFLKDLNSNQRLSLDEKFGSGMSSLSESLFLRIREYFSQESIESGLCEYFSSSLGAAVEDFGVARTSHQIDFSGVSSLQKNPSCFFNIVYSRLQGAVYCNGNRFDVGQLTPELNSILSLSELPNSFLVQLSDHYRKLLEFLIDQQYFTVVKD